MPTFDIPESVWVDVDRGLTAIAQTTRTLLARRWPDADVRVVDGPTVSAILTRAQRLGARVIVLGSRGHGPIARLLLGSTSLGVVRSMKHAALIVRGAPRNFARIVLGLDGSQHSRHAIALLAALDVPAGGQVTLVRVMERVSLPSLSMLPTATRAAVISQAAEVDAAEEKKWQRDAAAAGAELQRAGWKVSTALRKGAPLHELLAATKTARASLLVVGARGHGAVERLLLGSVAEGALHRAPVSVLVVR
jgi:nucleotide-binding universal stress UspA family protein